MSQPPSSKEELLSRAYDIAGMTFGELASSLDITCPENLKRDKGWVGTLIEQCLGATAGSKPEQDFQELGIELKTIPVGYHGKPLETTFVCVAPLTGLQGITWETSHIRHKLSQVLWVPVEGEEIPLAERRVGMPLLWQLSAKDEAKLKADWEELMEMIVMGRFHQITAKHGEYLQLRPKGANSKAKTEAYGLNGQPIKTLPLGFYLRTQFTSLILAQHFITPTMGS